MQHLLLLDEGFMSGAYTAIGLRDAGCRVTILAAVGGHGQYDGRNITWSLAPRVANPDFLATVDGLVRRAGVDRILPLTEPIQALLWDGALQWNDRVFPSVTQRQRVLLRDKWQLTEFMKARGIAVPRSCRVHDAESLREAIESLGLPIVVKGIVGRGGSTTHIARSVTEAVDAMRRAQRAAGECFAQQYLAGPTFLVGGVFDQGAPVRLYAGRKVIQQPAGTGPAAVIRSVHDERLLNAAKTAMAAIEWTGLASVDLIGDPEGRMLLLEINPRPWGSIVAAHDAGVDLYGPFAELLGGERPAPNLEYRIAVESNVFPLTLLSASAWGSGNAFASTVREIRDRTGLWHPRRQALHLAHRLMRVARNWRDERDALKVRAMMDTNRRVPPGAG